VWFPSYHCCACLKLLDQFLCHNHNVNHGRCAFRLHQGRAAFIDPFFVVWRCIRGRNQLKAFSTIWEQCFAAIECLRMDRKIKKWAHKCYAWRCQTPVHGHSWWQHWVRTWHGSVRQMTDYWWSGKLSCKVVMVLPMKLSTIGLAFIKFVQDGSHNNSQCYINKHAWTSANRIWITMIKKVTPSWTELLLVRNMGPPLQTRV